MTMNEIMAKFYGLCANCVPSFVDWYQYETTSPRAFAHSAMIRQDCLKRCER